MLAWHILPELELEMLGFIYGGGAYTYISHLSTNPSIECYPKDHIFPSNAPNGEEHQEAGTK